MMVAGMIIVMWISTNTLTPACTIFMTVCMFIHYLFCLVTVCPVGPAGRLATRAVGAFTLKKSIYLSIYLSVCLSIYLSIYQSSQH